MDWSIQEVAKLAGTTSRALRHYDDVGLLKPSRIGSNGYRYYDQSALLQLQRILLLRELGLGLPVITGVLDKELDEAVALTAHLQWLRQEQERLGRQITSIQRTIQVVKQGGEIMAENMLDGFNHSQYKEEVEQRWGRQAYAQGDAWWRGLGPAERRDWKARVQRLNGDWTRAAESGERPDGATGQALAKRHVEWLTSVPGTPAAAATAMGDAARTAAVKCAKEKYGSGRDVAGGVPSIDLRHYVMGLADLYVADSRFAAHYGGQAAAEFVRDALGVFCEREL